MSSKKPQDPAYYAQNIGYSSDSARQHVRRRPGMYIGGTNKKALHNMLWEVVDVPINEVMPGHCTEIRIVLHSDTELSVIDNGAGISVEKHENRHLFEIIMTQIWKGNFNNQEYRVSGGLYGIAIGAINALSSKMIAEAKREGYLWRQSYREGLLVSDVEQVRPLAEGESTGTSITFTPDFNIMEQGLTFDYDLIVERCRELAYLLPDVTFKIERDEQVVQLHQANGLEDWVEDINTGFETVHPILYKDYSAMLEDKEGRSYTVRVEVALQFRDTDSGKVTSFVNTVETPDNGSHVDGLQEGLIHFIYDSNQEIHMDHLHGLVTILHVYHPDPQFESQTRVKLLNPDVKDAVSDCVQLLLLEHADVLDQLREHFRA